VANDRTRLGAADTTEPGAGDTVDEHGSGPHRPEPPRKPPVGLFVAAGLALAAIAGTVAWLASQDETKADPTPVVKPPPKLLRSTDENLARARTCLQSLNDSPDWDACEAAAKAVLDENPIDSDGNDIQKKLTAERAAHKEWVGGSQALGLNRVEDGLEALERIPRASFFFARAHELTHRTLREAQKSWGERCKKYASTGKWPQAAVDCGWLLRTSCNAMAEFERRPAAGQPTCVKGKPKGCWAPKSEDLGRLLTALEKTDPGAPPWQCPDHPLYHVPEPPPPPVKRAPPLGDVALDRALEVYLSGRVNEAVTHLQKLQEKTENAALHGKARALQRDLQSADGLVKQGQTHLAQGKLDSAAKAFDEAFELEKKYAGTVVSALRKTAQAEMGEAALTRARPLMERGELKGGCKLLKLGGRFNRANVDLLNALLQCTQAASQALSTAGDCAALDSVLELAVEPDGLREKAEAKKAELACP
jgi:ABC transport system ATP-binding/permease protein